MDSLGKQLMEFIGEQKLVEEVQEGYWLWGDDTEAKINEFLDKAIDEMLQNDGRVNLGKADTHG